MITKKEKIRIQDLGKRIEQEAVSDRQTERITRYKSINSLHPVKPPIAIYPPPQAMADLIPESDLQTNDPLMRELESRFLQHLIEAEHWQTDHPVTDVFYTGLFFHVTDWMPEHKTVRMKSDLTSSAFEPCIKSYSDLEKLIQPQLIVDHRATQERFAQVYDVLGDILELHPGTPFGMTCGWGESMIDQLAEMRGLEQLYYDMIDAPDFVHEAMRKMTEGKLNLLKQYESEGVLSLNNGGQLIGSCSYPFSDELPGKDYDCDHITPKNLWAFSHAQEFTGVSQEMLEEFVLPYQAQITDQFGLCSYGCCEPIDKQVDTIAKYIKNLRIISISPFCDYEMVASNHRGKYVMACKLHPEFLINYDPQRLENHIKQIMEKTQGCCVTLNFAELTYYDGNSNVYRQAAEVIHNAVEKHWQS